jgi:hypothetical protein
VQKFLYVFGYCTPSQAANNEKHAWDDESSAALFVAAETQEEALQWGRHVSNEYVAHLYRAAGLPEAISWVDSGFASWIQQLPSEDFPDEYLARVPVVQAGKMPDFLSWPQNT